MVSWHRLFSSSAPIAPSLSFILISTLGASIAIGLTGFLTHWSDYPWQMAPFGASCVLVFGLPDSPLGQPRSVIGGHLIASLTGLLVLYLLGDSWWAAALAVGLSLAFMQISRTVHAPAGADPLVVMASHASAGFLLAPVLIGALVIVLVALLVNNLHKAGSYPRYWL